MAKASVTVALGADAGEFADAMDAAAHNYKEFQAVLRDGRKTFDATRTDAEKYEAEIAKLDHQLRQGAISQDTYNRAVAKAGDAFAGSPFKAGAGQANDFSGALGKVVPQLGGMTSQMSALGPAGIAAAAGIGIIAAEVAILNAMFETTVREVTAAFQRLDKLGDSALAIGISAEALGGLRYSAGLAGVGAEDLDRSMGKMLKSVGKAAAEGGKADEVFKRLGLDSKQLANLDADEQFLEIAAALEAIDNPAQRAAEGNAIFGKSWQTLAPLIDGGVEALRESQREAELFGQRISDVDVAAIQLAGDELDKVKAAFEGAANVVAAELAPSIAAAASMLTTFIKDSGGVEIIVTDYFRNLKAEIDGTITALNILAPGLSAVARLLGMAGVDDFAKAFEDAQESAKKTARMEAERQKRNRDNKSAIDEDIESTKEAEKAAESLQKQLDKIKFEGDTAGFSDAEKKLQELADAGATADQLIEANAALAAQAAAKDSEKALAKAQADKKKLDEMLAKAEKEGRQASMSDVDKKLDDLRTAGASQAELDAAKPMLEAVEAAKEAEKAQEKVRKEQEKFANDAGKLAESLRTPQEKYNDAVAEADKMRNAGLLDAAQHTKALAKAQADYNAELEKTNKPIGALEKGSAAAFSAIEAARRNAAKKMPQPQGLFPPGFQGQPQPQGLFPPGFNPPQPKAEDPFTVGGGKGGGVGVPLKQPDDPFSMGGGGKGGLDPNDLKKLAPPAPVVMPPAMPPMPSDPLARRAAEEAAKASKAVDDMRRRRGMEPRPEPIPVELPPSDEVPMPPMMPPATEPPQLPPLDTDSMRFKRLGDKPAEPPGLDPANMRFKRLGDKPEMPEPRNPPGMDAAGTNVEREMQREDPTLKKLDENAKRANALHEQAVKLLAEMAKNRSAPRTASFN